MDSNTRKGISSSVEMRGRRPEIIIDGETIPPIIYGLSDIPASRSWTDQAQRNILHFANQGVKLFHIDVCLCHCWKAPGQLDMGIALKELKGVIDACPNAAVFIRVHLNPPHWWMKANPEELAVYADGPAEDEGEVERIIGRDIERMMRVSLASEKWLAEVGDLFGEFCRRLAASPEGGRVAGIHVSCGVYGEWHQWGFLEHDPDYGKPMAARFRKWLLEEYGTDRRLQEAWGNPSVRIETASIPGLDARMKGGDGVFRDPCAEKAVIDSLKCLQTVVAEDIIHFCKISKESWTRPIITGTFYGYFFWVGPRASIGGHLEVERLYASPYVDYLSAPHSYHFRNRELGGSGHSRGFLESARLHGKLWLTEMDEAPVGTAEHIGGDPGKHPETIAKMRRCICDPLQRGMGFWYYDHRIVPGGDIYHKNGWWDHPALLEEIRRERELYDKFSLRPFEPVSDVALVFDTEVYYHLVPDSKVNTIDNDILNNLLANTGHAGAAYDWLYLSDIERADWSRYKTVIFANTYLLTPGRRDFIRKHIAKDGRHLVWLYASGYSDGRAIDEKLIGDATGMNTIRAAAHKEMLVEGCGLPAFPCKMESSPSPLFAVDDPEAEAIGHFAGSTEVGAAKRRLENSVAWFFSLPPDSPDILRAIFKQSGAHIYNDENDALLAGGGLLTVHTVNGGARELRLRSDKVLKITLPPCSTTVFDAESGGMILS